MNHFAVGDINQNDLRRMIDAINSMSGSRPRPTAKGLGRIELGGVSIDNAIDMSEKGYGLLARDPQWMLNLQQMHLLEIVEKAAQ
jgi:hypothetical protein